MLSTQDNELMCRTGPGTAMGSVMRRFWIPVMQSSDLQVAGGDPTGVELLGEHFVVYRDAAGRVGLFDEACLHRGSSMLMARAEPDGLRCIYHGWKFAVDGTVLDTPNVADVRFKSRIRGRTHPVREAGGLIWTYLGPADKQPEFPRWPWMEVSDAHRINAVALENCNFVQVIEGLVDSSHLTVLHASGLAKTNGMELDFAKKTTQMQFDAAPLIEVDETDFGFHYAAIRASGAKRMARVASMISPCFVANANGDLWFAVVPVNDERCNFYHVWWNSEKKIGDEPLRSEQLAFVGLDPATLQAHGMTADSCDGPNAQRRENRYRQDRELQRAGHFTGLASFTQEDAACSISSGALRDRSRETLSTADIAITRLYRTLLTCARQLAETDDLSVLHADVARVIGISGEIDSNQDWRALVPHHRIAARTAVPSNA